MLVRSNNIKVICLSTIFSLFIFTSDGQISNKVIFEKMFSSIKEIESLKFKLKKTERIEGMLKYGEQDVKFQRLPKRKIYTYIHAPNKGVELLWIEGKNNNHALIHPNGFPYINLNLDPYGGNMRKGNHHTIYEVGFDYIGNIVSQILKDHIANFNDIVSVPTLVQFNNKECYKVVIDFKSYKYVEYTVKKGETLVNIAYKNLISDYMILEKNTSIKGFEDVKEGQKILIPNAYAKKTILYIDKNNYLPIGQVMYDEKGLYEQYEFTDLFINPKFTDTEFTSDYKQYHF